jgi:hypothetical protein
MNVELLMVVRIFFKYMCYVFNPINILSLNELEIMFKVAVCRDDAKLFGEEPDIIEPKKY